MRKPINVGGLTVEPGTKAQGLLTIEGFWADGQNMEIPYIVMYFFVDLPVFLGVLGLRIGERCRAN